jgi:hypothetical protein
MAQPEFSAAAERADSEKEAQNLVTLGNQILDTSEPDLAKEKRDPRR